MCFVSFLWMSFYYFIKLQPSLLRSSRRHTPRSCVLSCLTLVSSIPSNRDWCYAPTSKGISLSLSLSLSLWFLCLNCFESNIWIWYVFRNSPLPCNVILGGSALGFDITPFAQQLIQLGGRRRQGPSPMFNSPLNPGMRGIIHTPALSENIQTQFLSVVSDDFMSPMNPATVFPRSRERRKIYWFIVLCLNKHNI